MSNLTPYRVHAWKAAHTGGTKFYHVMRVVSDVDRNSFHIEHYGKAQLFTGLGQALAGTVTTQPAANHMDAGREKIQQKRNRGYVNDTKEATFSFTTAGDLQAWLRKRLQNKAAQDACRIIDAVFVANHGVTFTPAAPPAPPAGMQAADFDYGTW